MTITVLPSRVASALWSFPQSPEFDSVLLIARRQISAEASSPENVSLARQSADAAAIASVYVQFAFQFSPVHTHFRDRRCFTNAGIVHVTVSFTALLTTLASSREIFRQR